MTQQEHILVVDDEPGIRKLLQQYLGQHGFRVSVAVNGEAMLRRLEEGRKSPADRVDAVILDLVMPGEDGLTLTRRLRQNFDPAIIILTSRDDAAHRVEGLERGADDYVTKPFNLRELLARLKAVLRRAAARAAVPAEEEPFGSAQAFRFAGWRLELATRELVSPAGERIALSAGEFDLLGTFLRYPGRVLSRERLLSLTRERDWTPFDRSVDVQVGRLRRKIEADAKDPALIKTVRGGGYMFTAKVEAV